MATRKAAATRKKGSMRGKPRRQSAAKKRVARKKTGAVARARRAAKASRATKKTSRAAKRSRAASKARRSTRNASRAVKSASTGRAKTAGKKVVARKAPRPTKTVTLRKPPALDRARRVMLGDDIVPTPPSSLDLDRTASAARTGRRELRERLDQHTETGPAMTAGDVDADWESAYSVGDEAPGGDNPTPDQDVVDDIGRAVGVQYDDNEELKGEAKIAKRDKHRWELDPASSEDFKDR
jgi:uncharacterized protein DUF6335